MQTKFNCYSHNLVIYLRRRRKRKRKVKVLRCILLEGKFKAVYKNQIMVTVRRHFQTYLWGIYTVDKEKKNWSVLLVTNKSIVFRKHYSGNSLGILYLFSLYPYS